jgi:hypothetical protein
MGVWCGSHFKFVAFDRGWANSFYFHGTPRSPITLPSPSPLIPLTLCPFPLDPHHVTTPHSIEEVATRTSALRASRTLRPEQVPFEHRGRCDPNKCPSRRSIKRLQQEVTEAAAGVSALCCSTVQCLDFGFMYPFLCTLHGDSMAWPSHAFMCARFFLGCCCGRVPAGPCGVESKVSNSAGGGGDVCVWVCVWVCVLLAPVTCGGRVPYYSSRLRTSASAWVMQILKPHVHH